MLTAGPFAVGLGAVFCYGMGIGLTIPSTNLMVAQASPENRSSALNLLNFSWSAGAVACPFLLAAFQRVRGSNLFLHLVSAVLMAVIVLVFALPSNLPEPERKQTAGVKLPWLQSLSTPLAIVIGALAMLRARRLDPPTDSHWGEVANALTAIGITLMTVLALYSTVGGSPFVSPVD